MTQTRNSALSTEPPETEEHFRRPHVLVVYCIFYLIYNSTEFYLLVNCEKLYLSTAFTNNKCIVENNVSKMHHFDPKMTSLSPFR